MYSRWDVSELINRILWLKWKVLSKMLSTIFVARIASLTFDRRVLKAKRHYTKTSTPSRGCSCYSWSRIKKSKTWSLSQRWKCAVIHLSATFVEATRGDDVHNSLICGMVLLLDGYYNHLGRSALRDRWFGCHKALVFLTSNGWIV